MRSRLKVLIVILVAGVVLVPLADHARVAYLTALLLLEVSSPSSDGPITERLPDPSVERVSFEAAGRTMIADVYRPASECRPPGDHQLADGSRLAVCPASAGRGVCPGIVLNHGVAAGGMNDLRLVNFADALARCGYVVVVPEFVNLKEFRVRLSDVDEVVASFRYLESLPDVDATRCGLFGFSYAGGLALLAANDPAIADRVRFCFVLGTYYDLRDIVTYATTGYYRDHGRWIYLEPRHTGKWAFMKNMLELVGDPRERRLLGRIADAKLKDEGASVSVTADSLGAEGQRLYELMINTDPERTAGLIDRLSPQILEYFDALSLPGNIENVSATLIVAHGRDDNLMPYTESLALAEHAPPKATVHLRILQSFQHVDLKIGWEGGPSEWVGTVAEVGRVFSVGYALLAEGLL